MIRLDSLTRRYGDFVAVNNVSCSIENGEVIGLLGRNGAGKSTIMKMLTGYLEPDSGRVLIDDVDMAFKRQALQARIGYLPENCPLYPEMTVAEYLFYRAALLDVPAGQRSGVIRAAVARTELEPKLMAPIRALSRGYRQRVGVAQAILHSPDIVILDEPTNGLDPQQIGHMRSLIHDLAEHATVIISTHVLQEVEAVCERVLILRAGELVADTRLAALGDEEKLHLRTAADGSGTHDLLAAIEGVTGVTAVDAKVGEYELALDAPADAVSPRVVEALVAAGLPIYEIRPQRRDLETLFTQVNVQAARETAHA